MESDLSKHPAIQPSKPLYTLIKQMKADVKQIEITTNEGEVFASCPCKIEMRVWMAVGEDPSPYVYIHGDFPKIIPVHTISSFRVIP